MYKLNSLIAISKVFHSQITMHDILDIRIKSFWITFTLNEIWNQCKTVTIIFQCINASAKLLPSYQMPFCTKMNGVEKIIPALKINLSWSSVWKEVCHVYCTLIDLYTKKQINVSSLPVLKNLITWLKWNNNKHVISK